jgi:hypothetical protein
MSTLSTPAPATLGATTLARKTPNDLRDELTDMVIRDLLGPAGGTDEELDQREDHVYQRYLVGMLAPKDSEVAGAELDELATADGDEGEEGVQDSGVPSASTYFPSSMGLSFIVAAETKEILIEAEWGQYLRGKSETQQQRDGSPANVWNRTPVTPTPLILPLKHDDVVLQPLHPDHPLVLLQGRTRMTADGWVVTLFMVNQQEARKRRGEPKDEVWVFQPKLRVRAADDRPIFVQRKIAKADLSKLDPLTREETTTLEMLYRHQREFAVGHGISVHATLAETLAQRAIQVETEWVPKFDLPQQTPRSAVDDQNLAGLNMDMKALAELPRADLIANLRIIETAYRLWIAAEQAKLTASAEGLAGHEHAAKRAVAHGLRALERIKAGVDLIESNVMAEEAFRFANRAMWQQRLHSTFARKVRKKEMKVEDGAATLDEPTNRSWRLFQLAFVLLNLPSLTDLHHADRSHETDAVADLLWFATGGGKTEAYLGLTAYTVALRRLQRVVEGRQGDHGVAVLMRYTLRLLTLQQFQRAAALMCACESIRRGVSANGERRRSALVSGLATKRRRTRWLLRPSRCNREASVDGHCLAAHPIKSHHARGAAATSARSISVSTKAQVTLAAASPIAGTISAAASSRNERRLGKGYRLWWWTRRFIAVRPHSSSPQSINSPRCPGRAKPRCCSARSTGSVHVMGSCRRKSWMGNRIPLGTAYRR